MVEIEHGTSNALMLEIQKIENGTDLKNLSVISRIGMRIANSKSAEMDADSETASSSALIDLAERLTNSVNNGGLREILVRSSSGFVILQFINDQFMLFGGIETPLRIGYYMEYLRNIAHRFAYILAGNQITKELKKEIDANYEREARLRAEAKAPIAANFSMDKNSSADMEAMEGVLDFLKDWGEEEGTPAITQSQNNVVGIDNDMMFKMGNFGPTSISQDQINEAKNVATSLTKKSKKVSSDEESLEDIFAALDHIAESTVSSNPMTGSNASNLTISTKNATKMENQRLPEDILATLDGITDTAPKQMSSNKANNQEKYPYGIPIYDGEVPPVPLKDYISFEVGTLTATEATSTQNSIQFSQKSHEYAEQEPVKDPYTANVKHLDDGTPDFNSMSSEYDDIDLDIEEDAMLQALAELDMVPDKKKK